MKNIFLSELTSFKIGGKAKSFFKPATVEEAISTLTFLKKQNITYFILGGGSNVLIGSKDYDGAVISTLSMDWVNLEDNALRAGSGLLSSDLSVFAYKNAIRGFEFLYKLPGTVGGAVLMNAKAFNSSISDIVLEVKVVDRENKIRVFLGNEIDFEYKKSIFQNNDYLIVEVVLKADRGSSSKIKAIMEFNEKKRLSSGHYNYPSAGCIFKNNYNIGIPSGKLIDDLGLKGERVGDAQVYEKHANFIINRGKATSDDVISLINKIKKKVMKERNINLECEVKFHGEL